MKTKCERCNGTGQTTGIQSTYACDTCCGVGYLGQDDSVDGVDHINIYSKGATELGRSLSNFAALKVRTIDGPFASIEGYWYWLSVKPDTPRRDDLRLSTGWQAKALGRELRGQDWVCAADFKLRIVNSMVTKIILHPTLCSQLAQSALPFRHYYVYGGKVVEPSDGKWIIDTWEHLRRVVQT